MPFNRPIPDRKPKPSDGGGIQTLVQAEKLFQIAILLPCAAFIGWLSGAWLDSKLHQSWIALAGIAFGGISGLVYVIRLVIASGSGDSKGGKGTSGPIS
jgi:ATP synthase protein I